jgi:CRP-like cAMP-binding protein
LFRLLIWLGKRFGRVSSQGISLSFSGMNLTHRNLAEMTGMTRVTVTKALIRFRQEGRIARQGDDELLRLDR